MAEIKYNEVRSSVKQPLRSIEVNGHDVLGSGQPRLLKLVRQRNDSIRLFLSGATYSELSISLTETELDALAAEAKRLKSYEFN